MNNYETRQGQGKQITRKYAFREETVILICRLLDVWRLEDVETTAHDYPHRLLNQQLVEKED